MLSGGFFDEDPFFARRKKNKHTISDTDSETESQASANIASGASQQKPVTKKSFSSPEADKSYSTKADKAGELCSDDTADNSSGESVSTIPSRPTSHHHLDHAVEETPVDADNAMTPWQDHFLYD